jgi:hypothetical protein
MKALKSELAKKLLADPRAREQLQALASTRGSAKQVVIELREGNRAKQYIAQLVAKAA